MKKLLFLIGLCTFATAGAQKKAAGSPEVIRPEKQNTVRTVDFTELNFPVKEYKNIDVDYIPFETTAEVLFDRSYKLIHLSKSRIITSNYRRGDVFVFDGKGKIVSNFNHKGSGPKEYSDIGQAVYDEASKEIFIFDRSNHCQVYSEDGSHQRTFKFPESQQYVLGIGSCAFDFDKETMLLYNNNESSDSLFIFLSKKDGSIKSFITFPLRSNHISNRQIKQTGDKYWGIEFNFPNITKNGDTYYLSTLSSDTIYQLNKDKKLHPFLVRKPPIGKMEDETLNVLSIVKATDKYILFMLNKHDTGFKNAPSPTVATLFMYEVEIQKVFDFKFDFNWGVDPTSSNASYPKNLFATFEGVDFLKTRLKNGHLEGKLKEVAEQIDEDDNPVLQVIKFPE